MMKAVFLLVIVTIVFCDNSSDVQKAFVDSEVIPDVLTVAPKNFLYVSFYFNFFKLKLNINQLENQLISIKFFFFQIDKGILSR